jgi:hypothetical protein
VFKSVTALLALGFPLVLFLSWVYDLTPQGIQKPTKPTRAMRLRPRSHSASAVR